MLLYNLVLFPWCLISQELKVAYLLYSRSWRGAAGALFLPIILAPLVDEIQRVSDLKDRSDSHLIFDGNLEFPDRKDWQQQERDVRSEIGHAGSND